MSSKRGSQVMRDRYEQRLHAFIDLEPEKWYRNDVAQKLGVGKTTIDRLERDSGRRCMRHREQKRKGSLGGALVKRQHEERLATFLTSPPEAVYKEDMMELLGIGIKALYRMEQKTGRRCMRRHPENVRYQARERANVNWNAVRMLTPRQLAEVDAIAARQNAEHVGRET